MLNGKNLQRNEEMDKFGRLGAIYLALIAVVFSAWITHVIVTIKAGQWIFLLAGAIFAPIGVVHGIGVWLGLL